MQTLKEVLENEDNVISKPNIKTDYAGVETKPFYYDFDKMDHKQK